MSSRSVESPCERDAMADVPDRIDLKTHRDLESWVYNRPIRYVILALIATVIVLGLLNVFGQRPSTTTADSPSASLEVFAPALMYCHRMSAGAGGDVKRHAFFGKRYVLVNQFCKTFAPIGRDE